MGRATDAILVYGYDLGGSDSGWNIRCLREYGQLPPLDWYDEDDEDDFATAAHKRLLRVLGGFTEAWTPDARKNGYWERRREAEKQVGVKVETYCSSSVPAYALAAHSTTVHRGDIEYIDAQDLLQRPPAHDWDSRLAAALDALGLAPVHKRPRWFLVSYGDL
ncbi:hypothetical protein ABT301_29265 [Streptomyces sp. NPDC000987]|uniref:hypothetical protein n=1 Tax=Streptomyces sp. NPDC000987 TaxID=3154374 RepID=UPI003331D5FF